MEHNYELFQSRVIPLNSRAHWYRYHSLGAPLGHGGAQRLPQIAVFLGLGAAIGPFGLNLINVDIHSPILRVVGTLSLVLVLFTDAVSLNLAEVRKNQLLSFLVLGPGTLLSGLLIVLLVSAGSAAGRSADSGSGPRL